MLSWEVELCEQRYLKRFEIKPGISGLWQVKGRNRLSMHEALGLDLEYVERRSVRLYVEVLFRTIPAVLFDRDCGDLGRRRRAPVMASLDEAH